MSQFEEDWNERSLDELLSLQQMNEAWSNDIQFRTFIPETTELALLSAYVDAVECNRRESLIEEEIKKRQQD